MSLKNGEIWVFERLIWVWSTKNFQSKTQNFRFFTRDHWSPKMSYLAPWRALRGHIWMICVFLMKNQEKSKKIFGNTDQWSRSVFQTFSQNIFKTLPLNWLQPGSLETRFFSLQIHRRVGYPYSAEFWEKNSQRWAKFEIFKNLLLKTLAGKGTSILYESMGKKF